VPAQQVSWENFYKYLCFPLKNFLRKKLLLILVGEWCYMVHGQDNFSFLNGTSFIFQTTVLSGRKSIKLVLQEMLMYEICLQKQLCAVICFFNVHLKKNKKIRHVFPKQI